MELKGRQALVTGGAVRIGRAIAVALAKAGCDVCVHYGRSGPQAAEAVAEIAQHGRRAVCLEADLERPDAAKVLRRQVEAVFGPVDILVNSASYWPLAERVDADHDLRSETVENWDRTLAVNARAPFFLIQELAPTLGRDGRGLVVNLLDESISEPYLDRTSHTVSKWALEAVTSVAARTLTPSIRVVGIECGAILPGEGMSDSERARRQWGGVDVVTDAVLFVARNPFISGEIISVRGNRHLRRTPR